MSQYFAESPTTASKPASVQLALADVTLQLTTDRGVFSHGDIDVGTKLLLQEAGTPAGNTLVDLGCGYGPMACTMAARSPTATVWAVDVNERARDLCRTNAHDNRLTNVTTLSPTQWPAGQLIDTLWSNPPIRIGKVALHNMLTTWLARLAPTGTALLVVQRHLGADSLQTWIEGLGRSTKRVSSRHGYRLLEVS